MVNRVETHHAALVTSLLGVAVSVPYPTAAAALWAVSAYLYVRHLKGAQTVVMPWVWVRNRLS